MTKERPFRLSGWMRAAASGLAIGLILILSGDGARSAVVTGIDPLEILKLQVRPNVILMLDSSGSMSESPNGNDMESADHTSSKLWNAKQTLLNFITANQTRVSFQFGTYQQPASTLASGNRFIWTTTDANAATLQINPGSAGSASGAATQIARGTGNNAVDASGATQYKLYSGKFGTGATLLNGRTFYTLANGTDCGQAASIAGIATNPPTIKIREVTSCATLAPTARPLVTFTFAGATNWNGPTGSNTCPGFLPRTALVDCQTQNQLDATPPGVPIRQFLNNELLLDASGNIQGYVESATGAVTTQPTVGGIRAAGFTPIANVLINLKQIFSGNFYGNGANIYSTGFSTPTFPYNVPSIISQVNPVLRQRTFAIIVTDGDDTCATTTTTGSGDPLALRAAHQAEVLYKRIVPADPASGVPTFLIAFGTGASANRSNWIAWGGSGMKSTGQGGTVPLTGAYGAAATGWSRFPTAAERATCITCQDAFIATTTAGLAAALQSIIDTSIGQGEFSDAQSIIGTVFELTVDAPATTTVVESPFDPTTRYSERVNILFQPTFELPGWQGHLYGFRNDGTFQSVGAVNSTGQFDVGQTLNDQVSVPMQTATRSGRPVDNFTFAELHAGTTVDTIYGSNALIKRRIFTSNGNGRFVRTGLNDTQFDSSQAAGRNVVALWPPSQVGLSSGIGPIDPPAPTAGSLDAALGVSTLTFAQAQALGACKASTDVGSGPAPALCVALDLPTAQREAREIILAWTAGATLNLGIDGLPTRDATTSELLYQDRGWILGDITLAAPAISTPPLRATPTNHIQEFILYRDGRRDTNAHGINEIDLGFGLRNPDIDDTNPAANVALKPVMTVVYVGANDGVHAFRAGPQCATAGCEQGSEELWSYVPFDSLGQLKSLVGGQKASPHVYIAASSMRIADVFIPDANGFTPSTTVVSPVAFTGRWRRVLLFGRGSGGKYYTALDVTAPGPFTRNALLTNPPWVLWNRGNPDTVDGTAGGTIVNTAADATAYAKMGQTWSVPAIGNVDPSLGSEWRAFMGSGYGDAATTQGKTFYQVDITSGDVLTSFDVPSGLATYVADNALVAGATAYNARQLDPPGTLNPSPVDMVTRVFIPDIQGRIWKVTMSGAQGNFFDAGPSQPIANAVSLLKIGGVGYVYANSGNDNRVPDSAGPFKLFGLVDGGGDTSVIVGTPPAGSAFPISLPAPPPSNILFRGTTQPATAFNANNQPRVFFDGTRFNPAGAASCQSSFDSILFAAGGVTGGAVYDFNGDGTADLYTVFAQSKDMGIQVVGGSLERSQSGSLGAAPSPTPDPNPTPTPAPPSQAVIVQTAQRTGSPVCRTP